MAMADRNNLKQDLVNILDNIGHNSCRSCTESIAPGCVHNAIDTLKQRLQSNLSAWLCAGGEDDPQEPRPLFYHLEQWRTFHPLGTVPLHSVDWAKFEAVQSLAAELQFSIYLAQVQRTEKGIDYAYGSPSSMGESEDDQSVETDESETEKALEDADLKRSTASVVQATAVDKPKEVPNKEDVEIDWTVQVQLDGRNNVEMSLDVGDMIQATDFFDLDDPDDEDVEDYDFGGAWYTREYRAMAIAIVPHTSARYFFSRILKKSDSERFVSVIDHLISNCLKPPEDGDSFEVLHRICSSWPMSKGDGSPDDFIDEPWIVVRHTCLPNYLAFNVMNIAVQHSCQELFDAACVGIKPSPDDEFLSYLCTILQNTSLSLDALRQPLIAMITSSAGLGVRYQSINTLCSGGLVQGPLRQLAVEALDESLRIFENEGAVEQDSIVLINMAQHYRDFGWLRPIAITLIEKKRDDVVFSMALIWELYSYACQDIFTRSDVFDMVKAVTLTFLGIFEASKLVSYDRWYPEYQRREVYRTRFPNDLKDLPYLPAPATNASLPRLSQVLVALNMQQELELFATTLTAQIHLVPELDIYNLYLPFLCDLIPKLQILTEESFSTPTYQSMYRGVIQAYWQKHAETRPQKHWSLKSRESKCPCAVVCASLNGFLVDIGKQSHTMSNHAKTGNKMHLMSVLRSMGNCLEYREDKEAGKCYITKRQSDWRDETKMWELRGFNAKAMLRRIKQCHLLTLLGDRYGVLMGITSPTPPVSIAPPPVQSAVHAAGKQVVSDKPAARAPLGAISQNQQHAAAGYKRKYDGIPEPIRHRSFHTSSLV